MLEQIRGSEKIDDISKLQIRPPPIRRSTSESRSKGNAERLSAFSLFSWSPSVRPTDLRVPAPHRLFVRRFLFFSPLPLYPSIHPSPVPPAISQLAENRAAQIP
ncbi:hypothetical protein GWI33_013957 [Rhynchophorus ferrugineus]|uniref:Uncharacterized protein n=1 Tax=Rhynchophorus ferrugineus TaxID=354439 RepID=A0A834I2E9_RHYFE|nr:hypothetical protein GWI33_013957 [Rhynchophorus ferrugineus]